MQQSIINSWITFNEVQFLQKRNPGVPGIIQKLVSPNSRHLGDVKALWKAVLQYAQVKDIYTGHNVNDEKYDIDHFVPWSFVASDELWNLIPAASNVNSSKSNKLPDWNEYSDDFADKQYLLYQQIFTWPEIYAAFVKCYKQNLNNQWAVESLYIRGHSCEEFHGILLDNLKPIYDSARDQGFEMWSNTSTY